MNLLTGDPETVPLKADDAGVIRIGATRVTLDTVVEAFREGATPEEIAQQYPTLLMADIYSVISYYLRHQTQVNTYLTERATVQRATQQQNEERFSPEGVRARLLRRGQATSGK